MLPEHATWWQRGVIYQIYPRSFADSTGDGFGDLVGIAEHADYLEWLGVDAVWLSPIYPTLDADFGYDVAEYVDVDPRFGTLHTFDEMLEALHARGIRLILDLVPNHTSDQHEWFQESRDPRSPRHEWYVWRDDNPDGPPPNNWESYFGGSAWSFLDPPGKWYLHSFDPAQPDLNWERPDVRAAMQDVVRFWLDRGVDGFRVDVLWLLSKDPDLRDNPLNPYWQDDQPRWLRIRRDYSEDGPRAHEFARLLRSVFDEYPDRVMIGEVVLPPNRAVSYHGTRLDEAHMPHNFSLTEVGEWSAAEIQSIVEAYEAVLPPGAWPNWLLGDHDFPRIATRVGRERVRLVHMLMLTLRGTPTCYYGDELGLPNTVFEPPALTARDPQAAQGQERDRLAARGPMPWSSAPSGGFSTGTPWLPVAPFDTELTVEGQRDDPTSMLSLFRSLIRLRRKRPALALGTRRSLPAPPGVVSYERAHPDGTVRVHLNFAEVPRNVDIGDDRILISTDPAGPSVRDTTCTLRGFEGVIAGGLLT
jgi:alpha-glucosidase